MNLRLIEKYYNIYIDDEDSTRYSQLECKCKQLVEIILNAQRYHFEYEEKYKINVKRKIERDLIR